jgi:hypothetical protein
MSFPGTFLYRPPARLASGDLYGTRFIDRSVRQWSGHRRPLFQNTCFPTHCLRAIGSIMSRAGLFPVRISRAHLPHVDTQRAEHSNPHCRTLCSRANVMERTCESPSGARKPTPYRPDDKLLRNLSERGLCPCCLTNSIDDEPCHSATGHSPTQDIVQLRVAKQQLYRTQVSGPAIN